MEETYEGKSHCYEAAKLTALLGVLATVGIELKDEENDTKVYNNGKLIATFSVSL